MGTHPLTVVSATNILLYCGKTVGYLLNGHFHNRPMEYQLAGIFNSLTPYKCCEECLKGAENAPRTRRASLQDGRDVACYTPQLRMYSVGHVPSAVHARTG